ncbi:MULTISPECIES: transcriptional regulator domain-containing protein [unclassified Bradyrhizobium]
MPTQYWRSPETIERLKRLERPGFALEFLRRNAEYRRDFARTQRQIARDGVDPETVRSSLARRWGLRFRS